jgi:hypothetical protein
MSYNIFKECGNNIGTKGEVSIEFCTPILKVSNLFSEHSFVLLSSLNEKGVLVCIGFTWLRIGPSDGFL